jgi:hypothetical protein
VWDVSRYYLVSLPAALAAIVLGRWIKRRLQSNAFIVYVHLLLIVIGVLLAKSF